MNHYKKNKNKLEKLRGIFFQLGLIIAGGLTLLAFEWTSPIYSYDFPDPIEEYEEEDMDFIYILKKKVVEKPKVKKEPKKVDPNKLEIVSDEEEIKEEKKEEKKKEEKKKEGKKKEKKKEKKEEILGNSEIMPQFKGGLEKLFEYLGNNIKYPKRDKNAGIQGKVYITFVVDKKGRIKDVKILRGVSQLIDAEALRVVKAMPNWSPGIQAGNPVSVRYNLPINFTLR